MNRIVYEHKGIVEKNSDELFRQTQNWMQKISGEPGFKIIYSVLFTEGHLWLSTIYRILSNVNYFVRSASIILAGFSHIDN
jgi:hypothetical protein